MKSFDKTNKFIKRAFRLTGILFSVIFNFKLNGPKRMRVFCERAGGAFVKLGQMLSLRQDFLSFPYANELLGLAGEQPAEDFEKMEDVFFKEVGMPIKIFFSEFDTEPIFAGPMVQVYFAKLENGEEIAVKIQRSGIKEKFEMDFLFIIFAAEVLDCFRLFSRGARASDIVADFVSWTRREFDLTSETKNASVIYEHGKAHPRTIVPKQYPDTAVPRVLMQGFISGGATVENILLGKVGKDELMEKKIDVDFLAKYLIKDQMRQYFVDGFFHADPHPVNLIFMPNDRLAYLDFSIVGQANPANTNDRVNFLKILDGIAQKNVELISQYLFEFRPRHPYEKEEIFAQREIAKTRMTRAIFEKIRSFIFEDFEKEIRKIVAPWLETIDDPKTQPCDKSAAVIFRDMIEKAEEFGVCLPREINLFFRSLSILDMTALRISPSFDMISALEGFFTEFSLEQAEEMIRQGYHAEKIAEKISPSTNIDMEFIRENAALENERRTTAKEKIMALFASYAEKYEEIRSMLKEI